MKNTFFNNKALDIDQIGGKASKLALLDDLGINVPPWVVISQEVLLSQIPSGLSYDEALQSFENLVVPNELLIELAQCFGKEYRSKSYAVRSSAIDEDGKQFSFAGQYESYLHVSYEQLSDKIIQVWRSAVSDRVINYRSENKIEQQLGIAVIIQEMIPSYVSGVAFGLNPVTGSQKEKIISAVFGLGEGLVSGELDADTYTYSSGQITDQLVEKKHQFVKKPKNGIEKVSVPHQLQNQPTLTPNQVQEIANLLDQLEKELGEPQDVEFAYLEDRLYILQTRPITSAPTIDKGEYILWDNSNIVESYPGITTPLTFSFIIKMYESVYRQFSKLLGVEDTELSQHKAVFANTLGLVRGRVYYNLLNWYKMLAMLPGYAINAKYMENMMGVKERFELKDDFQMSKGLARLRIVKMVFRMLKLQRNLPRERERFLTQLNSVMDKYNLMNFESLSIPELVKQYKSFESDLLLKWKAPLINDFFAMIWFGILQKQTSKHFPDEQNIHNDLLCGSQDIISVEPIHRTIKIANAVQGNQEIKAFFLQNTAVEIWNGLCNGKFQNMKALIDKYISEFGDRCVGELKLETISYGQDPVRYIKILKSYVEQGIQSKNANSNIENELRQNAVSKVKDKFGRWSLKGAIFNYVLRKARDVVSNRENLRFERTRGFGMVRKMFSALGVLLVEEGHLQDPRDVFYMELSEIKSLDQHRFTTELNQLINNRKQEFKAYQKQQIPEERFATYGNEFSDEYIYSKDKQIPIEGDLKGIGCCPGRVEGTIRVVNDPNEIESLNGDILVTSSTDPGWVTLFPTASAIIVERGSLLSHSAIVSREMGIPCIVSVSGLLRSVSSGDRVIMDGSTGMIQRLE